MLSQAVYNVAKAHALGLVHGIDKKVTPNTRSVIGTLMNMSFVSAKGRDNVAVDIEAVTSDDAQSINPHTALLGSEVERIAPMIQKHISFVQNTVAPKMVEMFTKLEEHRQAAAKRGPASDFDIKVTVAPPSITNSSVRSFLERYAQEGAQEPAKIISLPVMTYEDLLGFVKTNSAAVDNEISSWLSEKGQDWLLDIWAFYFASGKQSMSNSPANVYKDGMAGLLKLPIYVRVEVATAIFLLARGLYDTPPAEGATMTLSQWRANMDSYSRYAANAVKQAAKMVDLSVANKVVILSVSNEGKTASVYGPTYNAWLEAGGSAEVIMGAMISGKTTLYTAAELSDPKNNYAGIWSNYARISEQAAGARLDASVRAHALSLFIGMFFEFSEEEKLAFAERGDVFNQMTAEAKKWLGEIPAHTASCSETIALNLTARIRYGHTPAFQFLGDMIEIKKSGCDDPRQAATIAALNYLADSLSPHLSLVQA